VDKLIDWLIDWSCIAWWCAIITEPDMMCTVKCSDVVLETKVLVLRRLEDKKKQSLGLGLGLESQSLGLGLGPTLGLEVKDLVLVLVLRKKSWQSRLLWVWLIAGTKNNNLGRDWVLVLFITVLSELVYIRPTVFISYTPMRVVCVLFCSFCDHDMVTCSVVRVKSWSWS